MKKLDRIEYAIATKSVLGTKKIRFDFYVDEVNNISVPILKILIASSNIKEIQEKYAVLVGNKIYLFATALKVAFYYNNFIYSIPFNEGVQGGVKRLMVRMDRPEGEDRQRDKGVIAMEFFSPINSTKISNDNDRKSSYYFFQPFELLSLSYQIRETLSAIKVITMSEKYRKPIGMEG